MSVDIASGDEVLVQHRTRAPPRWPAASSTPFRIIIHHPAYTTSSRLVELAAFDAPHRGGIHHGTALLICGILAGNVWDGWFTAERSGPRLRATSESVLKLKQYYYHVPDPAAPRAAASAGGRAPYKYPIVPSFQHWRFPHDAPPPGWSFEPGDQDDLTLFLPVPSISSSSQAVKDRDGGCCLTGYRDCIERAHLCPRSENEWFGQQEMDRYNISRSLVGAALVDDTANALTLRADVHQLFDSATFVFAPKQGAWVAHFLVPTADLGPEYHNTIVDIPRSVHPAHILARLAWAVFPQVRNFLIRGEKRLVSIKQPSALEGMAPQNDTVELSKEALYDILAIPPAARSSSPKKRGRPQESCDEALPQAARESKRPRLHQPEPASLLPSLSSPPPGKASPSTHEHTLATPELIASSTTSADGGETTECARIAKLRKEGLRARRPSDPSLFCCDYAAAEAAQAAGRDGPKKFGGAHLCLQCLGMDVRDEFGPSEKGDV